MTKILLIDDEKAYLENLNTLLEEEGYETVTASNGMDGIEAAKTSQPDLIVCDIMLPDISGYMILEELRKRKSTKLIPFIFLTAKAEMSDLRKGMNLGADDYITKPFSPPHYGACLLPLGGGEKYNIAILDCQPLQKNRLFRRREEFQDGRLPLATLGLYKS